MSNIVSNSDTAQPFDPAGSANGIEGVGQPQSPKYGVDPFGSTQRPTSSTAATPGTNTSPAKLPPAQTMPESALPSITPEVTPPVEEPPITPPTTDPQTVANDTAASVIDRIPDLEQIMKDLEKSGCLLPDLHVTPVVHVDESPLAALQPGHVQDSAQIVVPDDTPPAPVLPAIQLGTSYTPVLKQTAPETELPVFILTGLLVGLQALQGMAQAVHFALVRYPLFEQLIMDGTMTPSGMNTAVMASAAIGVMALVSIVMAFVLFIKQPKMQSVLFYGSIAMVVVNFLLQNVLARGLIASGSPLALPLIFTELFAKTPPSL